MSNLYPTLRLLVKTYDEAQLVSQLLPSDRENIIYQLVNQTVWFPHWPYPLKHGDTIEFHGLQAVEIYNNLDQYNSGGTTVEILTYGSDVSTGIGLFTNNTFVDYNPGNSSSEAYNLLVGIQSFGKNPILFNQIGLASIKNITSKCNKILIPENEKDPISFDAQASEIIANWVNEGNTLMVFYPEESQINNINNIFGFSLSGGLTDMQYYQTSNAVGTIFESGQNTIMSLSATSTLSIASLPPDSIVVYEAGEGAGSALTIIPYGLGKIIFFGWDWYDAEPFGNEDGGWIQLLQLAIDS